MGWVHPWIGMGWVEILTNYLGWVGLERLNQLAASKVEVIQMARGGLRAGLL